MYCKNNIDSLCALTWLQKLSLLPEFDPQQLPHKIINTLTALFSQLPSLPHICLSKIRVCLGFCFVCPCFNSQHVKDLCGHG